MKPNGTMAVGIILLSVGLMFLTFNTSRTQTLITAQAVDLSNKVQETLDQHFRKSSLVSIATDEMVQLSKAAGEYDDDSIQLTITSDAGLFDWHLVMQKNDLRAPGYISMKTTVDGQIELPISAVATYKGRLQGTEGSTARLTIMDNGIEGYVYTNSKRTFIEPLSKYVDHASADVYVLYDAEDVISDNSIKCAAELVDDYQQNFAEDFSYKNRHATTSANFELEVATEADYEYYQIFGDNTNNQIISILNQVEGIYATSFDLSIRVTAQHFYAIVNDPYVSNDASAILGEFRSNVATLFQGISRDIAHMWTGKNMTGSTIGIAYIRTVCNSNRYDIGISQHVTNSTTSTTLTAHEVGHNLGLPHSVSDNCSGQGSVMCPSIQRGTPYFSEAAKGVVADNIATRWSDCLEPTGNPVVLVANNNIDINRNLNSVGNIHSNGSIMLRQGLPSTHTGNISAIQNITIKTDNNITGDVTAGGIASLAGTATASGNVTSGAPVAVIPMPSLAFTAGGKNAMVPANGSLNRAPGSYNLAKIRTGGTLFLTAGDYFFEQFLVKKNSKVSVDVSGGPVTINVVGAFEVSRFSEFEITPLGQAGSSFLTINLLQSGSVIINKKAIVMGTLNAPNAEVHLINKSRFKGLLQAQSIIVYTNTQFISHASSVLLSKGQRSDDAETIKTAEVANGYELNQNYPNPFNPNTRIDFTLSQAGQVNLKIYDILGKEIKTLVNKKLPAGQYTEAWNGLDQAGETVAAGMYIYRITMQRTNGEADIILTKKMALIK